MNTSASKTRAGEDGQVNQRLSDAIISEEDASVEELTLHRAAAVFRNEVLAGVGDENKALEEENSRFTHLRDCIQEVEITFSAVSSGRRQGFTIYIDHEKTMSLKIRLSQGRAVHVDDKETLVIPINNAPAHPIADCGHVGDISGVLAGIEIGSFPMCRIVQGQGVTDPVKMRVDEDGSVHLTFYLSPLFCIEGKLNAPDDVLVECVEREDFMTNMPTLIPFLDQDLSRDKGITFTPTSISMALTKHLRKTLAFVTEVASSAPSDYNEDSSVDNLRRLVVSALGESEHKELCVKVTPEKSTRY